MRDRDKAVVECRVGRRVAQTATTVSRAHGCESFGAFASFSGDHTFLSVAQIHDRNLSTVRGAVKTIGRVGCCPWRPTRLPFQHGQLFASHREKATTEKVFEWKPLCRKKVIRMTKERPPPRSLTFFFFFQCSFLCSISSPCAHSEYKRVWPWQVNHVKTFFFFSEQIAYQISK